MYPSEVSTVAVPWAGPVTICTEPGSSAASESVELVRIGKFPVVPVTVNGAVMLTAVGPAEGSELLGTVTSTLVVAVELS